MMWFAIVHLCFVFLSAGVRISCLHREHFQYSSLPMSLFEPAPRAEAALLVLDFTETDVLTAVALEGAPLLDLRPHVDFLDCKNDFRLDAVLFCF